MNAIIEASGIEKSFGARRVLRDVSFRVEQGETLCILGASGDGKTTLLKVLMGVLPPDGGSVRVAGTDVYGSSREELQALRRRIGVTFQSGALLNSMSLAE
ncbi:MAG: ATP-binding cassette domain-containing protein, partial [Acidobacteriota bacterium]